MIDTGLHIHLIGQALQKGEKATLEIRSYPEHAYLPSDRMDGLMFQAVTGGVIALLLSVIAYFLKLLIQDFRQLNKELSKLKELFIRLEAEQTLMKIMLQRTRSPPRRSASRKD